MMDRIWEQLMKIAESSNGFIRTAQVEEAGLSRMHLGQYVNAGRLERIAKGLYVPIDGETDEYALLQARSSKAVYSYGTALLGAVRPDAACSGSHSTARYEHDQNQA